MAYEFTSLKFTGKCFDSTSTTSLLGTQVTLLSTRILPLRSDKPSIKSDSVCSDDEYERPVTCPLRSFASPVDLPLRHPT
jgi:hypothetical protein